MGRAPATDDVSTVVSDLLGLAAAGVGLTVNLSFQHVENLHLALPELSNAAAPAERIATSPVKRPAANLGPWAEIKDREHVKRAAKFLVAKTLGVSHKEIGSDLAYDAYVENKELVVAAARAYHQLRKKRINSKNLSRPSYWDAAFVFAVQDGLATLGQAVDFANKWSMRSWTLADVGVVKNDLDSTVQAFNRALEHYHRNDEDGA